MTHPNPYNYNLPVMPKMFFGRQSNVDTLAHQLITGLGNSILLIGGRRMGKTSILEALYQNLQLIVKRPSNALIPLPVFLDLMGEGISSLEAFFHALCERSKSAVEEITSQRVNTNCTSNDGELPQQNFLNVLETWSQTALREHSRRLRLILLLDECEEILEHAWSIDLQRALRSLLVRRNTKEMLKVVMAGSHRLLAQSKQHGSPLWNVLTPHRLSVLNEQSTLELIMKPTKGCLSHETVQAIVNESGGHPFLTQYIMYHLWEVGIKTATSETVEQIALSFPRERSDFRDWVNCLGPSGLIVYSILAQTNSSLSEDIIISNSNIARLDVADALDTLCYHGLVVKETHEETYRIGAQMFRKWYVSHIQ